VLGWRVNVDDQLNVVYVHAARCNVSGDKHLDVSGGECGEVAVTGNLREVSVQVNSGNSGVDELAGQLLGVVLCAHEEQAASATGSKLLNEYTLRLNTVNFEHVVRHGGDVRGRFVNRVQNLVVQEAANQLVNTVVEGGAEQQALSVGRGLVEEASHHRQEAKVGHVVGLVKHSDLDGVEADEALLDEVFEAAGAGHNNVNAGLEGSNLTVLANPTEDCGGVEAVGGREGLDDGGNLGGELASRCEYEAKRATRAALAAGELSAEAGNHRQREGKGLTRASLTAAEHVASSERVRKGIELDGEWRGLAVGCECSNERGGHAKRAKSLFSQSSGAFQA
jgi:hypothetical protein